MQRQLNENIRSLRQARGLSQVQFASLIGVTKQCVSNWENDNVLPSIEMLVKIADIFRVSTDFLLGRSNKALFDLSELTEEQRGHLLTVAGDLISLNKGK